MNNLNAYKEQIFSFNNPVFFAIILSLVIFVVLIIIYVKVIYPMQKKFVAENQRYLLERAELMALFAEMDPDPLLRVNTKGEIVHTNESSRKIFQNHNLIKANILELIPSYNELTKMNSNDAVESIGGKIYNIIIKHEEKLGFSNIYLHDITDLKEYERKLEVYKGNLEKLSAELDRRYEELKSDLSTELHDDIGQKLIVVKLKLSQPEKYSQEEIGGDLTNIYTRIREISHSLSPINTNNLGLELTLQSMVQNVSQASGIKGSFELDKENEDVDFKLEPAVEKCILNTVQEALNNVVKHSSAEEFVVNITFEEERVILVVSDNGIGIDADFEKLYVSDKKGIGLFRMRERVKNLDGEFFITRNSEYKTNIIAKIPRKKKS